MYQARSRSFALAVTPVPCTIFSPLAFKASSSSSSSRCPIASPLARLRSQLFFAAPQSLYLIAAKGKGKEEAAAESNGAAKLAGGLTFGAFSGICAGLFTKKVGQAAMIVFGGLFVLFQAAAMKNYVQINWDVIDSDFRKTMDVNKDGKVDSADAKFAVSNIVKILTGNMGAYAGGFAGGFALGLQKG